jgi:hypothetical protein
LSGQQGHYDIPCLELVARSVGYLKAPPAAFVPVIELTSK